MSSPSDSSSPQSLARDNSGRGASESPSSSSVDADKSVEEYKNIFESPYIERLGVKGGDDETWRCLHCNNKPFRKWNATKALGHVTGTGNSIAACRKRAAIPQAVRENYQKLLAAKETKKAKNAEAARRMSEHLDEVNADATEALMQHRETKRRRGGGTSAASLPSNRSTTASTEDDEVMVLSMGSSSSSSARPMRNRLGYPPSNNDASVTQVTMLGFNNARQSQLTMAVADLIHAHALPFNLGQQPRFQKVLKLAGAPASYKPPGREAVRGDLLDLNFDQYQRRSREALLNDADVYGLTVYGDGATIKRMPLCNMLAASPNNPAHVLEILDCTGQLEEGGKKDARFIARAFIPHILGKDRGTPNEVIGIDPKGERLDLIYFDGAKNVQKAGEILEAKFPRSSAYHGGEHVTSLFFQDVAKLKVVKYLVRCHKKIYRLFGSGVYHAPHSMLRKISARFNNGRYIGLDRGADQRMASFFYGFLRDLRLKSALEAVVKQPEFIRLKLGKKDLGAPAIIEDKNFWDSIRALLKVVYPALKVLRLCDRNTPGMDKLYYYSLRCTELIENSKDALDKNDLFLSCPDFEDSDSDIDKEGDLGEEDDANDGNNGDALCDDDVDSVLTDYESDDEIDEETDGLGSFISKCWQKRLPALQHDHSMAGYLLSVHPEVYAHAKDNGGQKERLALERVVRKLFAGRSEKAVDELLIAFWKEHEEFESQTGTNFGRKFIWSDNRSLSYKWHKRHTLKQTKVFGYVACRVTSKVLGIGASERNWGHVKAVKTGSRSHMGIDTSEKQSIIHGFACMESKRIFREGEIMDDDTQEVWSDDFDSSLGLEADAAESQRDLPVRHFNAWIEEWEAGAVKKNDPVMEQKLLSKYGGLKLHDIDDGVTYTSLSDSLEFRRRKGWVLLAGPPDYEGNGEDDDKLEAYVFNDNLIEIISDTDQTSDDFVFQLLKRKDSNDGYGGGGDSSDH